MKGQVLHLLRVHLKVPGDSSDFSVLLTKKSFQFTAAVYQLVCTTNLQTPIAICCTHLLTPTMLKTPFHFLSSLDSDVYVVTSLTFPTNQRKCSSSSRTVATLTQLWRRLKNGLKQLTNSQRHKRHKRKRIREYRSHSLFIHSTYLSRTSFSRTSSYSTMTTKQVESSHYYHSFSFKRNKNISDF